SAKSEFRREYKFNKVDKIEAIYKQILADNDCFSLKTLQINGSDLIALGIKPGKNMGDILEKLLDLVIENPASNNREFLLQKATQLIGE
ncbi:MAG: polynucleotide adenylyltransferase, partial [Clostridiales bacterium]|nr:polynucleotide adenylyltransferase [Clostridiales bacterium]